MKRLAIAVAALAAAGTFAAPAGSRRTPSMSEQKPLYVYTLQHDGTSGSYDEAMAVACLQGIINRSSPVLYVRSPKDGRPDYWLRLFGQDGEWLGGREQVPVESLDALRKMAGSKVKGAVIWDPAVPATVNVANTIANVESGIVLSPEFAQKYASWGLPVLKDLRGMFTGAETGSAKNDAYRWAIREYLAKGRCTSSILCLYEDSFVARQGGDIGYVVTRDWAMKRKAFVYDLSPWGDEKPLDDPGQPMGTDLATYKLMLEANLAQSAGKHMTEVAGFFCFVKYSNVPGHQSTHEPVPTEWETVYVISPFNCYQNTVASSCFNQSLHSQAPRAPRTQSRPVVNAEVKPKQYICVLMADYDSATPLYDFFPSHWDDAGRGKLPLIWGINPNLVETYPDIIEHAYRTASPNDHFGADASAAGYFNPNRVRPEYLPLFVRHNRKFYRELDMTMSPMVLDWDQPTAAVKDAFAKFSPDGFATIVMDMHTGVGTVPKDHNWKGMPVTELMNDACNFAGVDETARIMYNALHYRGVKSPGFYFYRIVWTSPSDVQASVEKLKKDHPELDIEMLDPYSFFAKMRAYNRGKEGKTPK